MAARIFLLSILFTEVLRPACLAGIKGASGGVGALNASKSENFEFSRSGGIGTRLETEPGGNVYSGIGGGIVENVLWFRNGTATPPCGTVQCEVSVDGRLRFKMAKKLGEQASRIGGNRKSQSSTYYHCVVKNSDGSVRAMPPSLQDPYLAHKFNKSPRNVTVKEGEVARLSCCIDSIPAPPNITWLRDNRPLSSVDKTKYLTVSPGVLYINATKQSDAGSYRCVATNKSLSKRRTRKSRKATLRVSPIIDGGKSDLPTLLLPQISYSYQPVVGSDLTLVCASSGFPSLVFWTFTPPHKDGTAIEKPRILLNSTNSIAILTLEDVKISDEGDYQCSVKSFGKILQTQSIAVVVLTPPTFIKKPNKQSEVSGKSIRFECQAQGRPMPQIYWLKDSKPLDMNSRQGTYMKENNKMELTVSSTIPDDSGTYQCIAVNPAGEISAAAPVQINYLPQSPPAPTSLKCHALSPNSIMIDWETFSNTGTYITIHYAKMEPGSRENILPEANSTFTEVKALEPFTNYSVYARRWTKHAGSNQSATIHCSTAASGMGPNDVPIAAPTVTAQPIGSTKLNVSWIPLNKKEARGYVVQYKLQWRLKDHPSNKIRNLSSSITQYTLTDLTPGMHYEVRVLARTKQGWPNVSHSRFNWTIVAMPLANSSQSLLTKLVDLDVINIDSSTIKVEWKIKKETDRLQKNLDSWMLYYENEGGKKLTISLPKNRTEYLFTELEFDGSYEIRLCMLGSGESEACLLREIDPKRLANEFVLFNVEGVPYSPTSMNVSWSAVLSNVEHCYEVCYNAVYFNDSEPLICVNTTNVSVIVRDLKPYSLYQFNVRVLYNSSGPQNLYSQAIECSTEKDVPDAVSDLDWSLSNYSEVRIVWVQPSTLNGVVHNYTVYYTSSSLPTSPEKWANVTVPGNQTSANLPGLAYNTLYFVEVRAATNTGYGKTSKRIMIRTVLPPKNSSEQNNNSNPPAKPTTDQSLGIIVGVSISTCFIVICLSSIYCRKKWENTQSPRQSSQTLKDRVILRNGNGCCIERNSLATGQHLPTATATNDIELAVLCLPSPKTTNPHERRMNGIVESCAKEPLLTPWHSNGDSKDLNITENPQYKQRSSTGSTQQPEQELNGTQMTALNCTAESSGSSLNNSLERSESLLSLEQAPSTSIPVIGPNG